MSFVNNTLRISTFGLGKRKLFVSLIPILLTYIWAVLIWIIKLLAKEAIETPGSSVQKEDNTSPSKFRFGTF